MPSVRIQTVCARSARLGRIVCQTLEFGSGTRAHGRVSTLLIARGLIRAPRACTARFYSPQ
eukprot:3339058-Prymnesium_polylepis.1